MLQDTVTFTLRCNKRLHAREKDLLPDRLGYSPEQKLANYVKKS